VRRRLLILCYLFPTMGGGGVHRVLGFTRHLPDHGWDCTVLCAGEEDYWVTDPTLAARVHPGTEVVRVPGGSALSAWLRFAPRRSGQRPGRVFGGLRAMSDWWHVPDSYVGWSRRAARKARGLMARGFDAVLSSSPPDSVHLAALAARRPDAPPWIADFRDPWIGLHFRRPPTAWHRARHGALERRVLASADLVTAASATHARAIADTMAGMGLPSGRVAHVANGFEPDAAGAAPAPDPDPDHFTMVFTGTLSQTPDTEVFLDALHDVLAHRGEARRRLRVKLAGAFDSGYADRAEALGLTGIVTFMGPRPHHETRALQRAADALLLWKVRGFPTMVPGKLYEYLDAGRPLVAVLEPGEEATGLATRAGATVVRPGDRAALAAAIEHLYVAWREGNPVRGARPDWLDGHTRAARSAELARHLDRLAGAAT